MIHTFGFCRSNNLFVVKITAVLLTAVILFGHIFVSAQSISTSNITTEEKKLLKQDLEKELETLREQIENLREGLAKKNQEAKTLNGELERLQRDIRRVELEIKEVNLVITRNTAIIDERELAIQETENKIQNKKEIIKEEIRAVYMQDSRNLVEIILSEENLSDFLSGLEAINQFQNRIQTSLIELKGLKRSLEEEVLILEEERDELSALKMLQIAQKKTFQGKKVERQELLEITKGEEAAFQRLLKQAEKNAEQIKNQIYVLEGGGQTTALSLEDAYQHAVFASKQTGVRPAFLMALVQQESNWGANVGTGSWKKDMHPRDYNAFLQITSELGLDPDTTPVSAKPSYGWGGALGPAQFLPQTWLTYADKAAEILGRRPNPWDIRDAFLTAAIKLANAGAANQSYDVEWKAAMIYFAGSRWNKPYYRFYGDQVMQKAQLIQEQLDKM